MYSAGAGETALDQLGDADRDPNSVYTRNLLPLLKTPGAVSDGGCRTGARPSAARWQRLSSIARRPRTTIKCSVGCASLAVNAVLDLLVAKAAEAWDRTKDTTSLAAVEAFIRRFSDTYYGDLARVRLAELVQAEVAKKKAEAEAQTKAEAERQRLAILKGEQDRERAEAVVKKKADNRSSRG